MDKIIKSYAELPDKKKAFLLQEKPPKLFIGNRVYGLIPEHTAIYKSGHVEIIPQFLQIAGKNVLYYSEGKQHYDLETALILYSIPTGSDKMYGLFYIAEDKVYDAMFADKMLYNAILAIINERSGQIYNPGEDFGLLFEQMRRQNIEALSDLYLSGENIETEE